MNVFSTGWSNGFDGPGRRWVLYAKGCNFRCRWCANPEGLVPDGEVLFYPERGEYAENACPKGSVKLNVLDRRLCRRCTDRPCINVWRHPAFAPSSFEMSPEEIVKKAVFGRPLFGRSGGVTLGGGEPTLQMEELSTLLPALRAQGIDTAVETNASRPDLGLIFGRTDLLICDLKCVDGGLHKDWTGCDNPAVLANLTEAAAVQEGLLVRVTLVKGFNDGEEETSSIGAFLEKLLRRRGSLDVEVLRMHHLGGPKYRALGIPYPMAGTESIKPGKAAEFVASLKNRGINAKSAG